MAANIGPKIGIDGEAQYRREMNAIIQQARTLASEMKMVTSSFASNESSQESLTAQMQVLTKQIEVQESRIAKLKEGLSASADKYGEADARTQKWQQAVNEATAELNRMNSNLSKMEDAMESAGNDVENLDKNLDDASDSAASFGDVLKANLLSQAIQKGFEKLVDLTKDLTQSAIEMAAEVKAESSQFEQTFGDLQDAANKAIGNVADEADILQTRLNTLGSQIYAFAKSSGASSSEAMELMETALRAAADGAAYYDRSLEDTTETLQSFLKGNYANDAALGVSCTETTRNAKAMELFGEEFKNLTEIQKQQTLLQMVTDAQELSGAMGQAAREADGWENVQGNLNESWNQFLAQAGTPILQQLIPIIQDVTAGIVDMTNTTDWEAFGRHVTDFVTTVKDNGPEIVSVIAGIGAGFVTWNVASMISGVVTSVKAFQKANEGATVAQALMNTTMLANPAALVVTALVGITAAVITLWNTNEDFRKGVIKAWNDLKSGAKELKDDVVGFFSDAVEWFKGLPGAAKEWGADMIEGFKRGIQDKVSGIINSIKGLAENIRSYLHFSRPDVGPLRDYETWMPDMIDGMVKGIRNNEYKLENAIAAMSEKMTVDAQVNGANVGRAGTVGPIQIIVNAAEGQDVNELAEMVAYKIEQLVERKGAVFA